MSTQISVPNSARVIIGIHGLSILAQHLLQTKNNTAITTMGVLTEQLSYRSLLMAARTDPTLRSYLEGIPNPQAIARSTHTQTS